MGGSLRVRTPPCITIIWRESARPMPEPLCFVVKKGTKISLRTSAGMGAVVAAITALLTALTASACSPGLAPAVALAFA